MAINLPIWTECTAAQHMRSQSYRIIAEYIAWLDGEIARGQLGQLVYRQELADNIKDRDIEIANLTGFASAY